ncbi:tRNA 2-selenouridine(34) synthase MnmH [Sulfurimonas sp.]
MSLSLTEDFHSIVLNNTPLLDVRAPVEFNKGAFVNATNIAILEDEERRLVGIKYKEEGNQEAIKLAETLIKQEGKHQRVAKWKEYLKENPDAYLYCFRGGQRSGIAQAWLKEDGIDITRLKGGYKKFRNYLMEESLTITAKTNTLILGGRTGSGKTILLKKIPNSIDLEGIANHRGSSFGNLITPQPAQINFENTLYYKLIQFDAKHFNNLVIEHESHNIGRAFIPKPLYENFLTGQLLILETPLQERVEITYNEYILESLQNHIERFSDDGIKIWAQYINNSLDKIQKRLGSQLYTAIKLIFKEALQEHVKSGNTQVYKKLVQKLLEKYYDPMYDYQIKNTSLEIIFRGNQDEILAFIRSQENDKI